MSARITAKALVYGDAEGGENDENLYKALVSQLSLPWGPGKVGNVSILYCPTLNAGTLSLGLSLCPSVLDSKVGPSMIINGQTIGMQKESMKGW